MYTIDTENKWMTREPDVITIKNNIISAVKKVFTQAIIEENGVRYTPEMKTIIPFEYNRQHLFVQIQLLKDKII